MFKRIGWSALLLGIVAIATLTFPHWHGYRTLGIIETHRLQSAYRTYLTTLDQHNQERPTLSASELWSQMQAGTAPVIVDVRTREEYQVGHVPSAIHLDYRDLPQHLDNIPAAKDETIVTYCRTGVRAGVAEQILREAGFTSVLHLAGDMTGWIERGLPAEG